MNYQTNRIFTILDISYYQRQGRVLHKGAWVSALLGALLGVQGSTKVKFCSNSYEKQIVLIFWCSIFQNGYRVSQLESSLVARVFNSYPADNFQTWWNTYVAMHVSFNYAGWLRNKQHDDIFLREHFVVPVFLKVAQYAFRILDVVCRSCLAKRLKLSREVH